MKLLLILSLTLILNNCVESRTYLVSTANQLHDYLRVVQPGDTIQLRDGYYSGRFSATRFGRADAPIKLVGTQRAVLTNRRGTALYVSGRYWYIKGFTVSNSQRGIAIQNGDNNLVERVVIRDTEEEGIVIKQDSDDNTIRSCIIINTGRSYPQYGYGIAIGSDESQGFRGYVDRSDRNTIANNHFQTSTTAEAIHAFEGTCCGNIRDNTFDGRPFVINSNQQLLNRGWAIINGNNYRIDRNSGKSTATDGFRVRMSDNFGNGVQNTQSADDAEDNVDYNSEDSDVEIQGCGNRFRGNRCEGIGNGYCIRVLNPNRCRVYVYRDNRVVGGGSDVLTNVAISNL